MAQLNVSWFLRSLKAGVELAQTAGGSRISGLPALTGTVTFEYERQALNGELSVSLAVSAGRLSAQGYVRV